MKDAHATPNRVSMIIFGRIEPVWKSCWQYHISLWTNYYDFVMSGWSNHTTQECSAVIILQARLLKQNFNEPKGEIGTTIDMVGHSCKLKYI